MVASLFFIKNLTSSTAKFPLLGIGSPSFIIVHQLCSSLLSITDLALPSTELGDCLVNTALIVRQKGVLFKFSRFNAFPYYLQSMNR